MVAKKAPSKAPSKKLKAGKKKSLNKWILIGGAAVIALLGLVVVRYSSASTAKSFSNSCANNYLNGNNNRKVNKSGSGCSYSISSGQHVYTLVPASTMAATRRVCAQVAFTKPNTRVTIQVAGARNYGAVVRDVGGGVVCTTDLTSSKRPLAGHYGIDVYVTSGTATVSRIDGTPSNGNAY